MRDPFALPVLGIDLGATFTKVSYRPGWKADRRYEEACRLVMIDNQPLVPSLVIRRKSATDSWLCGSRAATYRPTEGDRVFSNWKADLFSDELTPAVGASLKAAGEFFRWLHGRISDTGIDVDSCRVKVCLPAFDNLDGPASILGQEMDLAGWQNVFVTRVTEPRANTVGIFSEGRNSLYISTGPPSDVNPTYMEMYPMGSPLLKFLRKYALDGGSSETTVVLVDIGSFTTDLSIVNFDAQRGGDYVASEQQISYKVGIIDGFEKPLMKHLESRHGFSMESLTFVEREAIKAKCASGEKFALPLADNRVAMVGDALDAKAAQVIALDLAKKIRKAYENETSSVHVNYAVLTGGGSVAPLVSDAIRAELQLENWVDVEGLESTTGESGFCLKWPDTGVQLTRLATALGASSVILDLPAGTGTTATTDPPRIISPWIACTCHGGNKDCLRCCGRGMYKRSNA